MPMKLPNPDRAIVDIRKVRDYCLNPASPRGQTKARAFASVLGLRANNADRLRSRLVKAARETECVALEKDDFGQR